MSSGFIAYLCFFNSLKFLLASSYRGIGRWFGKWGLYRSIAGKGSLIRVYKIEPSYVANYQKTWGGGAPAPGAPMVPMPMSYVHTFSYIVLDTAVTKIQI